MFKNKSLLSLSALLIISLTACNLPSGNTTPTPDLALTITALSHPATTGRFHIHSGVHSNSRPNAHARFHLHTHSA